MRDHLDKHTIDFVVPELSLLTGRVVMDKRNRIAIVARRSAKFAHLLCAQPGVLKLTRVSSKQLLAEWMDSDCRFEEAVDKLLSLGKRHGFTDSARAALDALLADGRTPQQASLFI